MNDLICCTCLFESPNQDDYISIHENVKFKDDAELELNKMLENCTNLEFDSINVNCLVCHACMTTISFLYNFRESCLASRNYLLKRYSMEYVNEDVAQRHEESKNESVGILSITEEELRPHDILENECLEGINVQYIEESNVDTVNLKITNISNDELTEDNQSSDYEYIADRVDISIISDNESKLLEEGELKGNYEKPVKREFECSICQKNFTEEIYLMVSLCYLFTIESTVTNLMNS